MNSEFLKSIDTLVDHLTPCEGREKHRGLATWIHTQADALTELSQLCHNLNRSWWHSPETGEPIVRNKGELLCLIHSEISEAMEGERKNLMDDKLPHRKMAEVELADAVIRIFDYSAGHGYDLTGALIEKLAYNLNRADHKHENRVKDGGKAF